MAAANDPINPPIIFNKLLTISKKNISKVKTEKRVCTHIQTSKKYKLNEGNVDRDRTSTSNSSSPCFPA